jgi:hypothetical protein
MMLFLGTAVWEGFPGAATRVLLPLTLAFNVLVHRRRASVVWLIAGNLSVFSGVLALRDVPRDPAELVAQRLSGSAAILRSGPGWFDREHDRRHTWLWTREKGTLSLERMPPSVQPVRLHFSTRSLVPRFVVLSVDGWEIWRAQVGTDLLHHAVTLPAKREPGLMVLEFSSDSPAVSESQAAGARELAFALYDLRLALPEP